MPRSLKAFRTTRQTMRAPKTDIAISASIAHNLFGKLEDGLGFQFCFMCIEVSQKVEILE
jgi:hypothetical protein